MTELPATKRSSVLLEFAVLDGEQRSAVLVRGEMWTFGRGRQCSQTLSLPSLSRVALVVHHLDSGILRVTSRQSNLGRVLIASDDGRQHHTIGLGAAPVHLAGGNYTLKVEVPPIVLRMLVAVPFTSGDGNRPRNDASPKRAAERTALSWAPDRDSEAQRSADWITVAALAVAVARYPELSGHSAGRNDKPMKMSESLRRAAAAWCGRSSLYWVNERLKEATDAADLAVAEGGERVGVAVAHYAQVFSESAIRQLRDELLVLLVSSE